MATYGANILPTRAEYYTLTNASLVNGVLSISPGGSAVYNVPHSALATLTEYFQVSVLAATDWYAPTLYVRLNVKTTSGDYYSCTCTPTSLSGEVYKAELKLVAEEYESFVVTIYSSQAVNLTLWELAPQTLGADIQTIIDGVEQSLPRLLYDYNTSRFSFGQRETTIGIITCYLIQPTDIQGHLLLAYDASATCTITLRFKDNEATELFAPVHYDVHAGRGTLGVPHAYLNRLAGYHTFNITAQCSTGTVSVNTREMLFTIDGGYLAERRLDIGANISDMTFESGSGKEPAYIWIASVEACELLVRRRDYSRAVSGEAFEPMYSLGEATDGAIEFDGDWVLDMESADSLYHLSTYAKPYVFVVDATGNLYVQYGDVIASKTLLDTGVSSISVCRGYKSLLYPEQDQGLIALYIKNGVAWYRQYAYDGVTSNYVWLAAVQVTGFVGTVLSAHVHRLNDYRVGFAITTSTENYWMISSRTYVGQAHKPEVLYMSPKQYATVGLIPANAIPVVTASGVLSDDRKTITATFSHNIRCVGSSPLSCLTIPAALRNIISTVEVTDNTIVITTSAPLYVPYTIALSPEYFWHYQLGNNWLTIHGSLSYTYDPYGHISAETSDTVSMNVSQLSASINLRPLGYLSHAQSDSLTMDPALTASITQSAINYISGTHEDTMTLDPTITATITLLLVGEQPI